MRSLCRGLLHDPARLYRRHFVLPVMGISYRNGMVARFYEKEIKFRLRWDTTTIDMTDRLEQHTPLSPDTDLTDDNEENLHKFCP